MIFDLAKDFSHALAAMPPDHPRRRILSLLEEALRRDVHFIDRHPTTLFQCLWNAWWWYDCPETARPAYISHRARFTSHSGPGVALRNRPVAQARHTARCSTLKSPAGLGTV